MTTTLSTQARNVNWLLSSFVENTAGVEQSIAVSSDGLLMAASANLDRAAADKMAAIVSGLRSLSDGASRVLAKGAVSQIVVEMRHGFLFACAISGGSSLGVMSRRDCDLGLVGYEMTLLVERFGNQLTPELVAELKASLAL